MRQLGRIGMRAHAAGAFAIVHVLMGLALWSTGCGDASGPDAPFGIVRGVVADSADGVGLDSVSVVLEFLQDSSLGTTEADGTYSVATGFGAPEGVLRFQRRGYRTQRVDMNGPTLAREGEYSYRLDVELARVSPGR